MSEGMTNEMLVSESQEATEDRKGRWITGTALVAIGLLALAAEFGDGLNLGRVFMLILGSIFLIWGIWVREVGLLIPGGIVSGIGLGVYLLSGPFPNLEGSAEGGVFMLSFAAGWLLIVVLSAAIRQEVQWWALIPGGIMAAIGGALLAGGMALELLDLVGRFWPVALVIAGIYVIVRRGNAST